MVRIRKKLLENILHLRRNPIKVAVNFSEVRKQAKMYYCYVGELSEVQITSETQNKSAQFDFFIEKQDRGRSGYYRVFLLPPFSMSDYSSCCSVGCFSIREEEVSA